jgi:hypothetical protein
VVDNSVILFFISYRNKGAQVLEIHAFKWFVNLNWHACKLYIYIEINFYYMGKGYLHTHTVSYSLELTPGLMVRQHATAMHSQPDCACTAAR